MALDDSVNDSNDHESPDLAVKNRSRRIRKIKHSEDFEYNNLDEQEDGSAQRKGKRVKHEEDDDFGNISSPKKIKRIPSKVDEDEEEGIRDRDLKKKLSDLGIEMPKKPKGGYVAFVTSIRESVAAKYPKATFGDLTHLLADEWNKLPQDEKNKHLEKARAEKKAYLDELDSISTKCGMDVKNMGKLRRRRSGMKPFTEKVRSVLQRNRSTMFARKSLTSEEKYQKLVGCGGVSESEGATERLKKRTSLNEDGSVRKRSRRPKTKSAASESETDNEKSENLDSKEKKGVKSEKKQRIRPVEIRRKFKLQDTPKVEAPIFTEDFLEINKGREAELRQLKKAVGDLEEQTVALRHHVMSLDESHAFLEENISQHKKLNSDLSHYVVDLSNSVVKNFGKLKLPLAGELTHGNIGKYMEELLGYLDKGGKESTQILKLAKGLAATLSLPA